MLFVLLPLVVLATPLWQRPADTLVISDVTVLPMDGKEQATHQTVVIVGNRIVRISPAEATKLSSGTNRIDGRGKFLLPGLADMHVHLSTPEEFPMYIGNGVLTVRDLNGSPKTLAWRQATASGQLLGPRIFTSGPMFAGPEIPWKNKVTPSTAAEAEMEVLAQKAAGYDLIKIYDGISREVFDAAIATACRVHMPSTGHIPESVGFMDVVTSGITGLEHLDKTIYATMGDNLDTLLLPKIVDHFVETRTWVTPTLASMIQLSRIGHGGFDSLMARPEARAAPSDLREFWTNVSSRLKRSRPHAPGTKYDRYTDIQMRLAGDLARGGARILAGTDLPNAVLVPGYSLHDELDALTEAGLTRYQALEAATSAPARFFGQGADWGTITVGARANAILADANPLDNLAVLRAPAGVVVEGKWMDRATLESLRKAR